MTADKSRLSNEQSICFCLSKCLDNNSNSIIISFVIADYWLVETAELQACVA